MNKTTLFLLITFSISFLAAGIFYLAGGEYKSTAGTVLAISYMFIPLISVLIVEKWVYKEAIKHRLLISFKVNRWFVVAWLIAPVIAFGAFGVGLLMPDVSFAPEMSGMFDRFEDLLTAGEMQQMKEAFESMPVHPLWLTLLQGMLAGITINAVAAFGEELGWRGFLVNQFRNKSFLKAALLIGLIWGIWHAPIILMGHNYPEHPVFGVFMMIVWCILLSPLFLYITLKSKSVIAASVLHGTLNGTAGIGMMMLKGGSDLTVGVTGLAGFISLGFILFCFYIYDRYISNEKVMHSKLSINYEE